MHKSSILLHFTNCCNLWLLPSGSAVGVIIPDSLSDGERAILEDIFANYTASHTEQEVSRTNFDRNGSMCQKFYVGHFVYLISKKSLGKLSRLPKIQDNSTY